MNVAFRRFLALALLLFTVTSPASAGIREIYVSPGGSDQSPGTHDAPLATLSAARGMVNKVKTAADTPSVLLLAGTYYLTEPFKLEAADSGTAAQPIVYSAAPGAKVTISGGRHLELHWTPYKDGIYQADVPGGKESKFVIDQLFINGERQHMARYPNFNPAMRNYGGTAADAISPARVKMWANPVGGLVHGLHGSEWGDFHYRITAVDDQGKVHLEGGWQNNRASGLHKTLRFVENIFEELDAPGEWFFDRTKGTLYVIPAAGVDLSKACIESAGLKQLVDFHGSHDAPVRFVTFRGITFTHTARTFLEPYEPLMRSDWRIHRGAAIFMEGTEDCVIDHCTLQDVGGNAIFVSNYNRRATVKHCSIIGAGASAICFVGDPRAARFDAHEYGMKIKPEDLDTTPGPKTDNYPADCRVEDCLLHNFGVYEKQTAGVEIDLADSITVSHASIYDCPRAGINIGDGCWGGHVIEYCDVFDTVKETGDHGSFNAWGRDRYWGMNATLRKKYSDMPLWDCRKTITLHDNRWRCDHGWDVDLDDGSSNYHIFNNLFLNGGLKFREGYQRIGENNIMVNNSFHPHVWYPDSGDVFRHNIVMRSYAPIGMPAVWGKEVDENLLPNEQALMQSRKQGRDRNSLAGDPQFIDPAHGDFRVKESSPALKVGFKNFPMDEFGVVSADLRSEARVPEMGGKGIVERSGEHPHAWMGAQVKSVTNLGEVSAAGLSGMAGVMLLEVPEKSPAAVAGLKRIDVIVKVNGKPVSNYRDFERLIRMKGEGTLRLEIMRGQKLEKIEIKQ